MKRGVQQHRTVAGGQHEPVTVGPLRIARVVAHHVRVEQVRDRRHRHWHAGMAAIRLLDGVDRERPDRVDAEAVDVGRGSLSWTRLFGRHQW
jgi:hypothetical protein